MNTFWHVMAIVAWASFGAVVVLGILCVLIVLAAVRLGDDGTFEQ